MSGNEIDEKIMIRMLQLGGTKETDEVTIIGLLTAVHKDYFRVVNYRDLLFNDFGDRVAQLLHVELIDPFSQCRNGDLRQEILIVNTHLLFPHDSSLSLVRLHQVNLFLPFHFYFLT